MAVAAEAIHWTVACTDKLQWRVASHTALLMAHVCGRSKLQVAALPQVATAVPQAAIHGGRQSSTQLPVHLFAGAGLLSVASTVSWLHSLPLNQAWLAKTSAR